MIRKTTLGFAAIFLLSACAVGPDYEAPKHDVDASFKDSNDKQYEQNEILIDWWRSFNDQKLNELIDDTVRGNKTVAQALARVNEARAFRQESEFDLLPTITSAGSYQKLHNATSTLPFDTTSGATSSPTIGYKTYQEIYQVGADATWELDLFGRVRREVEENRAAEDASMGDLQDALRVEIAEMATNYLELRGAQATLAVAAKNAKSQSETVRLTKAQADTGQASELDTARAEAQYHGTEATIPPLEASIKTYIHRISVLTGRNPEELEDELLKGVPIPNYKGAISIGDPVAMLRSRPDVHAAERRLAAATADIGVNEGNLFPKVTFNGTLTMQATTPQRFGDDGTGAYAFGPNITWPFLDMGHQIAKVHVSTAHQKEVLAQYEQSVLTALEETENALAQFSSERRRRDSLRAAAERSAKAASIAQERYKAGSQDFLTVLDAERTQLQAESDLSVSDTQLRVDLVALYKALGGGWQGVEIHPHSLKPAGEAAQK